MASKVEAISLAPQPRNGKDLQSFLGLLHHYGKFLTGLAMLLHPLNHPLKAGQKWTWTKESTEAFEAPRKLLVTALVLAHYDPSEPIKMPGDTSVYGIGAVRRSILKLKKRPCHWCTESESSTSICTVGIQEEHTTLSSCTTLAKGGHTSTTSSWVWLHGRECIWILQVHS